MPYGNLGVSFQPGSEQNGQGGREDREAGRATPIQTAIKLLSLRLPTTVSPSALAPQALLQGQGGVGFQGGMNIEALLRRLLLQGGAGIPTEARGVFASPLADSDRSSRGVPSAPKPAAPSVPTPRITPGQQRPAESGDFVPQAARDVYESGGAVWPQNDFSVDDTAPIEPNYGGPLSPFERALGRRFL